MKYMTVVLFLLFSFPSKSTELLLGGWSKHYVNTEEVYNEKHNMIGIKYNKWSFGKFTNSYNNKSVFLNKTFEIYRYDDLLLGVVVGVVTGYNKKQTKIAYLGSGKSIFLMPMLSYKVEFITINNGIIPTDNGFVLTTSIAVMF